MEANSGLGEPAFIVPSLIQSESHENDFELSTSNTLRSWSIYEISYSVSDDVLVS